VLGTKEPSLPAQAQPSPAAVPEPAPAVDLTTGALDLFVLPVEGVKLTVDDLPPQDLPQTIRLSPGTHRLAFTADGYMTENVSQSVVAGTQQALPIVLKRSETADNSKKPAKPQPEPKKERPEPPPVGSLSLDAVVPVDVYLRGKQVGTTPLTFQLPPGEQTIEYRYQGFQKTASYVINKNETTRAIITFEVDLQVNARPWAQVSLEGTQKRILGQTPLNTRVPVGSVLLFQNPRFPDKKYIVTGRDKTVQVMFP
jgi:hypothetical protein